MIFYEGIEKCAAIAQSVVHYIGSVEVIGSIPISSSIEKSKNLFLIRTVTFVGWTVLLFC